MFGSFKTMGRVLVNDVALQGSEEYCQKYL